MTLWPASLAVLLGLFVAGTVGSDVEPDVLQALVVIVYGVGLIGIGYFGGWWTLPIFALAYLMAAQVNESYFWHASPYSDSIDYGITPMSGYEVTMPFLAVPVALGALARRPNALRRNRE
jgi:prepilin signal peptidase PulO-like enzyme (type II secretory pathway)